DDVRVLVLVGERVFDLALAEAAILAGRRVRAVGIVDVVFHRLRELPLEPSCGGDRIDDVAAFFVHDDPAGPHGQLGVTHDDASIDRPLSSTVRKSRWCTTNGLPRAPLWNSAIARSVAFLHRVSRSAPVSPSARRASSTRSTSAATGTCRQQSRTIAARSAASGFAKRTI